MEVGPNQEPYRRRQLPTATALLEELIAENPDKANLRALQAGVYMQLEKLREAIVDLEKDRRRTTVSR